MQHVWQLSLYNINIAKKQTFNHEILSFSQIVTRKKMNKIVLAPGILSAKSYIE